LDNGQLITEGAAIVQYIAGLVPDAELAPRPGTFARVQLHEWLTFIATELHKGFGSISNPKASEDLKQAIRQRLDLRFGFLARAVATTPYLLGQSFSVADGYAYYTLRNLRQLDANAVDQSRALKAYFERVESRPAVRTALTAEGLS
jgi:glutathione S-transferase